MSGLLTVGEVAIYLRVAPKTVYNWVANKAIPCIRVNNRFLRFRLDQVNKWLREFEQEGRKKNKSTSESPGQGGA